MAPVHGLHLLTPLLHAAAGVPAEGGREGVEDRSNLRLQVCDVSDGVLAVHLLLDVAPEKKVTGSQVRRPGRPVSAEETPDGALRELLVEPSPVGDRGVRRRTVLHKPPVVADPPVLAVELLQVGEELVHQHLVVSATSDADVVAVVVFEVVGSDYAVGRDGAPYGDFLGVEGLLDRVLRFR